MKIAVAGEIRSPIEIRDGIGHLIETVDRDPTGEASAVVDWTAAALNYPARRRMIETGHFMAMADADGVVEAVWISTKKLR